ncbi:chymotrypsin-2-like [Musca vetustissima]|uniref:chymotrypsin-2-like n=1 Tax=Musca vetustissima TaxID=27455 RepID=UPI002AB64B93|nr:chymotrypsin-2-like [Musca vetustissima]
MRSFVNFTTIAFVVAMVLGASLTEALRVHQGFADLPQKVEQVEADREQKIESRIIGGEIAAEGSAPWQVTLQNQYGNHFCGGVIIGDKHVLTAASCVAGQQKRNIKVIMSTNDWMGLAWLYEVAEVYTHCNFDKPLYHNDIAVLELATYVAYDEKTQNITMAQLDDLKEGEVVTMTGWGNWEVGQTYFPSDLKKLSGKVISNEECKRIYGKYADDVDDGHICVQPPYGSGACHGDTGGPLVDSKGRLVGIGNWGVPCGHGFPDVFAKVSFFYDFIRTSIQGCAMAP